MSGVDWARIEVKDWSTTNCCTCGIEMILRDALIAHFRKTHESFYCPRGHQQSFRQPNELETARASLKGVIEKSTRLEAEVRDLKARLARPKGGRRKAKTS